jgi:hypothetical protein
LSAGVARLAPVALAIALVSCGAGPQETSRASASAITNGTPAAGDLGVVALMQATTLTCTATLVAPRVVLTAAHCLAGGSLPDAFFGESPSGGGTRLHVIATQIDPTFDATTLTDDVALALLEDAAPVGATPWPLPTSPVAVGMPLRLVGFGATGSADTSPAEKRVGRTTIASVTPTQLTFAASPSQTCSGDSGGPAFATIAGVETVVGVTSSGDPSCDQGATDTRVDAYLSFLSPWLAATAEGAAGAGDRCWYSANCGASAGDCVAALDDPALSFCAPACGDGSACPAGLSCLADAGGDRLCRHATPSPGALGAACTSDSDCADGPCLTPSAGGASLCSETCFQDLAGFCPSGYECAPASGAQSGCFADAPSGGARAGGGCNAGGGGTEDAGVAALAMAAAALLRRALRGRASRRTRRARYGSRALRGRAMPY